VAGFVSFTEVLAGFVQNLVFIFGARSTLLRCLFHDTRLQRRSPSSSAPAAGSSGHGGTRFPARGRHAPECLSLFGARVGHVPLFLAVHGVGWGLRWSFLCWVVPGTARVLHEPPSPADSAIVLLPAAALGFSVFCVHFHVSTVDHSLSICNAQMFMGLFGVWVD
jgi:hypothetical protein